ncbi:MAG: hypothetical protein GY784_01000, partial [Gammaproteobacteria bacterium]|nr:hypothetical protein [Gammaproteobacteria bacterium]
MASVKITTLETVGSLQLSGFDVTLNQVITKADIDAGNLEFVPVGDGNGTGYDSFGFSVNDGTTDSVSTYTMTVDVTAVNDAPTFSTGDGIVTTAIGSGDDRGRDVTVQTDGKILVAGYSYNGTDNDFSLTRYNADGTLDTTFGGGDGIVTTDIGSSDDYGQSVKVQSDGKIVVAGYSWDGADYQFALVRYDTDGTLDTTFDTDGKVTTDLTTGDDKVYSVDIQSDGKILVAGRNGDLDFALVRYNTDGSLDTDFDSDGIVATDFPFGGSDFGDQVLIQSDGKILVSGRADTSSGNADFALARYNSDGSLDTTFGGGDGMVTTPISGAHDMGNGISLQSDGKIVQAGYLNGTKDFAVIRYNTDGTLDTTFDTDGIVTTDFGGSNDYAYRTTVQADGKILVMGESNIDGDYDFALVRYNTDGSLDTTFDSDGIVTTDFGNGDDTAYEIVTQSDGKILVVGQSYNGSNYDIALVRYNADGSLDTSFNQITALDGTATFSEGGSAVVLDSNVQISDTELDALGNYSGASLTLVRNGGTNSNDVYSETGTLSALTASGNLVVGGTTIGTVTTNSGGMLVLTFSDS